MAARESNGTLWREEYLRLAIEAARIVIWAWQVDSDKAAMDERAFELSGLDCADEATFDKRSARINPFDRDRVRAAFNATPSIEGSNEIDFRIFGDKVRWIAARDRAQRLVTYGCRLFTSPL